MWKKRKTSEKTTEKSKPHGENEEKTKKPPTRGRKEVWKKRKTSEKTTGKKQVVWRK